METPPLTLLVLDALADDIETAETMRDCGEMALSGVALAPEADLLAALRTLLDDGSVEALEPDLTPASAQHDEASLRRYLFRLTDHGRQRLHCRPTMQR